MQYQALTSAQQSQVEYLFADAFFGTDATSFEYEVQHGEVIGRMQILRSAQNDMTKRKPRTISINVAVREMPAELVTVEMQRDTAYTIQSIARHLVEQLIQSQTLEAHHG